MKRLRALAWLTYESTFVALTVLLIFVGFAATDNLVRTNEKFNRRNQSAKSELIEELAESLLQRNFAEFEQLSKTHELTSSLNTNKRFSKLFEDPVMQLMQKQKSAERQRQVWRNLPDLVCYGNPCRSRMDCCRSAPICHSSAHVCLSCQMRSACTTDADCCADYPYCHNPVRRRRAGECHAVPIDEGPDGLYKRLYRI